MMSITNAKTYFKQFALVGVLFFSACEQKDSQTETQDSTKNKLEAKETVASADNALTDAEKEAGWQLLFNGKDTNGWRSFNKEKLNGWVVEDGTFKALGKGGDTGGDIIFAGEEFDNFELSLEWKIGKGGNSGIFYHVLEGKEFKAAYESAPEYQLLDDEEFPEKEKLEESQKVGADYGMYAPDNAKKKLKKSGEWNHTRIIFTPEKAEYWLNGEQTVSFKPWSDDWKKRVKEGKWKDFPKYGSAKKGFIGLQDHGSEIWFKNIKIKKL